MSNFEKKKLCLLLMLKQILREPGKDAGISLRILLLMPLLAGIILIPVSIVIKSIFLLILIGIGLTAIFLLTTLNFEVKDYTEKCLIDPSSILTFERFQSFYTINPKRFNFELLDDVYYKGSRALYLSSESERGYVTMPFKTKEDAFLILLWHEDRRKNAEKRDHDKKSMENNELLIRLVKKDCENFLAETEKDREECLHDLENQIDNLLPKS